MKKCAFFDVDNTLVQGNVSVFYAKLYRRIGVLSLMSMIRIGYLAFLHKTNLLTYEKLAKSMVSSLKGIDVDAERVRIKKNFYIIRKRINTGIEKELRKKKKEGFMIVLLTNAIDLLVEPLAAYLGADGLLSSRLGEKDGKLTGELLDVCYGKKKKEFMLKYCLKNSISVEDSYFYSDSYSDLSALKQVGHPIAVKPDRKLRRFARLHNWQIID